MKYEPFRAMSLPETEAELTERMASEAMIAVELKETGQLIVNQPFGVTGTQGKFDIVANVTGGGISGQAGAIRHGVARALLTADANYRPALKAAGFLTRDPRMKERKKYGLKAARRAPQFSKR